MAFFLLLLLTYYQLLKMFAGIFFTVANLTPAELCLEGDSDFRVTSIPIGPRI